MKQKRDQLISSLDKHLKKASWAKHISWNIPEGGFFITIRIPFRVDKKEVIFCAENYQVIFTPMSFFYLDKGGHKEIRLAFSNVRDKEIEPAIRNLVGYFKYKLINN
jgi:(S)-3,5-dihydroxyphenylglycine transaminase